MVVKMSHEGENAVVQKENCEKVCDQETKTQNEKKITEKSPAERLLGEWTTTNHRKKSTKMREPENRPREVKRFSSCFCFGRRNRSLN